MGLVGLVGIVGVVGLVRLLTPPVTFLASSGFSSSLFFGVFVEVMVSSVSQWRNCHLLRNDIKRWPISR
jgi:hypothetical protein